MNRWYARRWGIYLAFLALLGVDAGVYWGWVRRPGAQAGADPAQVARLNQEVAERAAEVARLGRLREQAPRLRPQLDQFVAARFLPERTGFSRVAAELDDAAAQADAALGRVAYDTTPEKAQPDLVRVEMATSVEGDYPALLDFLGALERSPQLYLLNDLSLVGTQGGQVRLEMRLATYFRRGAT